MPNDFSAKFLLDVDNPTGLYDFLKKSNYLLQSEKLELVEVAGHGNMNVVLRVYTDQRSFILKQPRPWAYRFPDIPAPSSRVLTEFDFYTTVRKNEILRKYTPEIYFFDVSNFILCIEDFGRSNDFTFIYKKGQDLAKQEMADMARVVSELHFRFRDPEVTEVIVNDGMRTLNHEHIFVLPLETNNGFDLDGVVRGFQKSTEKFRQDKRLKRFAHGLGEVYLGDSGTRLLHGDYYPGSWLRTDNGFRMIDPEFCFTGRPEFELGVAIAHLKLGQQSDSLMKDLFVYYHFDSRFDGSLFSKFAGMEMIRRLLGLAQLPLELDLKERLDLLDEAYELVLHG